MVNGMIQTGNEEVEAAEKAYSDASATAAAKAGELATAQAKLIYSKGELEIVKADAV